jgi:hypothetical protein
MIKVIDDIFPLIERLRCWYHLLTDIDLWVKRHGGVKRDSSFYKMEAKELFKCDSFGSFKNPIEKKKGKWDESFTEYFETYILTEANQFGRWKIETLGLYCPYGGITTNISEGSTYSYFY